MISLLGGKTALFLFSVFCAYGAIRLNGVICIGLGSYGLSCIIVLAIMLSVFAEVHNQSMRGLRELAKKSGELSLAHTDGRSSQIFRKCVGSLAPVKICAGSMYYIDKFIVLVVFKLVTENIINVLLLS